MNIKLLAPSLWEDYELIDSGNFEKLERFGRCVTARPEPQALWNKSLSDGEWKERADAYFVRDKRSEERGEWVCKPRTPEQWFVEYRYKELEMRMRLGLTSFKHVGIFPEQAENWNFIYDSVSALKNDSPHQPIKILNLFAYTGGASLAARGAGAEVTHVDSVKQTVTWSRENMEASAMDGIRWIVEDALKFVRREVKRGNRYHGIILDPPAYGRGAEGERWILEENLGEMLALCGELLGAAPGCFLVLNLYSMGLSALLAQTATRQLVLKNTAPAAEEIGELYFSDSFGKSLPLGVYYRFTR